MWPRNDFFENVNFFRQPAAKLPAPGGFFAPVSEKSSPLFCIGSLGRSKITLFNNKIINHSSRNHFRRRKEFSALSVNWHDFCIPYLRCFVSLIFFGKNLRPGPGRGIHAKDGQEQHKTNAPNNHYKVRRIIMAKKIKVILFGLVVALSMAGAVNAATCCESDNLYVSCDPNTNCSDPANWNWVHLYSWQASGCAAGWHETSSSNC